MPDAVDGLSLLLEARPQLVEGHQAHAAHTLGLVAQLDGVLAEALVCDHLGRIDLGPVEGKLQNLIAREAFATDLDDRVHDRRT